MTPLQQSISDSIRDNSQEEYDGSKYSCPVDAAEFIFPALEPFLAYTERPSEATLLHSLIGRFMWSRLPYYEVWLDKLFKAFKIAEKDTLVFGDADVYISLLSDTPEQKVISIQNTCSCADITNWILSYSHNSFQTEIHVRGVYPKEESDYPKAQYPQKLSLDFHKDRNYIFDYVEKYHMTKLGGVYGDIRDQGYVISYKRLNMKGLSSHIQDVDRFYYSYNQWTHFTFQLNSTESELDEILNGTNDRN